MSSLSRKNFPLRPDILKPAPAACQCGDARVSPLPDDRGAGASRLAHLYLCEGLSTYGIAQVTGQDRQRVTRLLHRAGVPLRPRGAGGTRPASAVLIRPIWVSSWPSCMSASG